ncbi:TPA: hypothetical protein UOJ24_000225 [Stenotrophomonas maltophilia]|nr:hypothetical protein [Stenotrophomonas maltophilia]
MATTPAVQPSPGGQGALAEAILRMADHYENQADIAGRTVNEAAWLGQITHELRMLAARQPVHVQGSDELRARTEGERAAYMEGLEEGKKIAARQPDRIYGCCAQPEGELHTAECPNLRHLAARQPVEQTFQAGMSKWMGQCFLPSLYSNMTERGDRLLEEVLELLQAHGYDKARVPTLVDYVFGRPVGEPAQEVGGVMVTLAGYCWVAGLDMHAAGDAELARISQPEVMAKIRAKQEAKNALHFDTPLPGNSARQPVGSIPAGFVLVPEKFGIPAEVWEGVEFVIGGPGTGEGEAYLDSTAWIGDLMQDDGSSIYGLHLSCDECPEEGSVTLSVFTARAEVQP